MTNLKELEDEELIELENSLKKYYIIIKCI